MNNYQEIVGMLLGNWDDIFGSDSGFRPPDFNRDRLKFEEYIKLQRFVQKRLPDNTPADWDEFWTVFYEQTSGSGNKKQMDYLRLVMKVIFDWWYIVGYPTRFSPPDFDRSAISLGEYEAVDRYLENSCHLEGEAQREQFWALFKRMTHNYLYQDD